MKLDFYLSGVKQAEFVDDETQLNLLVNGKSQPLTGPQTQRYTQQMQVPPASLHRYLQTPFDFSKSVITTAAGEVFQQTQSGTLWIQREHKPAVNLVVKNQQLVGFQITVRDTTAVIIQPGDESLTVLADWQAAHLLVTRPLAVATQFTALVPMHDQVKLATEVLLPADGQPTHSTILSRTPYGRQLFYADYQRFVQRGYAVVVQDVRGRNDSEGEWLPMAAERDDGRDTVDWIAAQPWSNQNVGMIGGSYGGYVQWAAASSGTPHLKALVSMVTAGGPFNDTIYKNGAPISGSLAWFFSTAEKHFHPENMQRNDWPQLLGIRPLENIPVVGLGHAIPGFTTFMTHPAYDDFMANMDWKTRAAAITVPALIQSGWFDDNGVGTTETIRVTDHYPAGKRKLILGPWVHSGNAQYDLGPIHLGEHALRADIDRNTFAGLTTF